MANETTILPAYGEFEVTILGIKLVTKPDEQRVFQTKRRVAAWRVKGNYVEPILFPNLLGEIYSDNFVTIFVTKSEYEYITLDGSMHFATIAAIKSEVVRRALEKWNGREGGANLE